MKFYETHFEDYIISCKKRNLHPKLNKVLDKVSNNISQISNLIFYGPSGVGKYTQLLNFIKKYSPTELKYEKKISILYNKKQYYFKISDIHYEIDMSLLGCNSKLLWNDIYLQLIDIISAKNDKSGIIVCKNFHEIHNELLDIFYSYIQQNNTTGLYIKFFILTEQLSFIPDNILESCEVISIPRPSKTNYNKCIKTKNQIQNVSIYNIKTLYIENFDSTSQFCIICDKIIEVIMNIDNIHFIKLRELLYTILIYNLDISQCIWYILSKLIANEKINANNITSILIKTYGFFQYYNNNYRPIYHIENYLLYIMNIIHKLS
jgi:hypothetical protein